MADATRRLKAEASLGERLDAVVRLVGLPVQSGATAPTDAGSPEALQARLAALTTAIDERAGVAGWDDVDRLTARLLLADLVLIAGHFRAVTQATRARLTTGREDLERCRNVIVDAGTDQSPISRP